MRVRFGAFELDAERGVLRKHGLRVRVPAQSVEILAELIAAGGETVTRERIQSILWPNGTVVGFDQSINAAVKRLREALGESADSPRFVERVPRQGYRFLGRVEPLPAAQGERLGDRPGASVLHYHLLERVGRGSMGEVWKARDARLDRVVALKFVEDGPGADGDAVEAARREARLAASVNHPNVCALHGLEEHEGRRFLVMEFVEGRPLSQSLAFAGVALPPERVVDVGIQAADGLSAAHAAGLVHGDVKPANLMLGQDGVIKLTDFGLAMRPARSLAGTRSRRTGTIEYMSPEQARGEAADARSDLFSLGVVLYELATGRPPFTGDTPAALFESIARATPPSPREVNHAVPRGLSAVVDRALEKRPEARWPSAPEMAHALRAVQSASRRRAAWRRRALAALAACLAIAAAAAAGIASIGAVRAAQVRRAYTLALSEKARGNDAVPLLERVLRQDPQFAPAWLSLAQVRFNRGQEARAEEAMARAYELRGRASELERLLIEASYHSVATKDYEKAIAAGTLAAQLYPATAGARRATFLPYCLAGEMDKALAVARREVEAAPDEGVSYFNLAIAELERGATREARAALERARARGISSDLFPFAAAVADALDGDADLAHRLVPPTREMRTDARMAALATQTAGYFGRLAHAAEIADSAATSADAREVAAVGQANVAMMEAVFGRALEARARARRALRIATGRRVETNAALALALAGAPDDAEAVLEP
ncbi:MAG: protein kinase domain-containing protein, partial [Betaproteobacteria bacterium]